jgi:putative ABC transport system permease protein
MFWRLVWKSVMAGRGRMTVALVAIVSGAAVSSALLNLQLDADRKLTREFRALGANLVVTAAPAPGTAEKEAELFSEAEIDKLTAARTARVAAEAPYLFVIARGGEGGSLILAGTWLDEVRRLAPWWKLQGEWVASRDDKARCLVGHRVAQQFLLKPGMPFVLRHADRQVSLEVAGIITTGGAEDSQVFVNLPVAQQLAGLPGRVQLAQISVTGTAEEVQQYASRLGAALPGLLVRPIRQITQAEGQLLGRLHLLLLSTVALVLVLTSLCVLASMATRAMERRTVVGLMKALGGPMPRVVRLFLAEVGLLGAAGGSLGALLGMLLSAWIGQRVFGTAISPRWEVLPLTIALMVGVTLLGALPLRLLGGVRPAVVLRGG